MKKEPLKNKEGYVDSWNIKDKRDTHPSHRTKVFEEEDVKSAVEWLKDRIDYFESEFADFKLAREFKIMIDEAFEDVK